MKKRQRILKAIEYNHLRNADSKLYDRCVECLYQLMEDYGDFYNFKVAEDFCKTHKDYLSLVKQQAKILVEIRSLTSNTEFEEWLADDAISTSCAQTLLMLIEMWDEVEDEYRQMYAELVQEETGASIIRSIHIMPQVLESSLDGDTPPAFYCRF